MSTDERRAPTMRGMFDDLAESTRGNTPIPAQAEKRSTPPRGPSAQPTVPPAQTRWAMGVDRTTWRWWMIWQWNTYHWFAAIWWLFSWLATYQAVVVSSVAFPPTLAVLIATVAQVVLTVGERPIMRRELVSWREDWLMRTLCLFLLVLDTALNTGGLIPFVRALLATPLAAQLREIGITPTMSPWIIVSGGVTLGLILALAPEVSWNHAERRRQDPEGDR